ncbi:class I SAM-dependent methyltransferase [Nocardia caishijiensis]|uniref:Methyltransferase family protein n=1 Tax=Nocardia caishijiensis TaxID=184756 RepID=A0ABQ6YML4_9NOCA|nr:class I SAM-dependent methyltransferase [Nocardia caishijiensis]KAF0847034.1 methyltransferase family protein [Nocardia caishijiensis]
MGFYTDRVLPHLTDKVCGARANDPLRRRVCAGLRGDVVEIGFGSGNNVGFYPEAVHRVSGVEPADIGWKIAANKVAVSRVPIERAGLDGQALPFSDDSFDTALSTFTLCTIPDVAAALTEIRRVLKPGGSLHFVEHGLAPDESVRVWQHRLDPIQQRIAGGCHLARDIPALIADAGFDTVELDRFYQPGAPKAFAALSLGVAR